MTACTRCEAALELGDLRCAICALPVALAERSDAMGRGDSDAVGGAGMLGGAARKASVLPRARVLRCGTCGAAVAFVAEVRAPRCGFCSATMDIEQPIDPIETAQRLLPFTVDRAAAEAAMRGWLAARGWFAPRALASEAVLEALTPLSWAAWLVNAEARVAWTADSDAGALRSPWAPHAGEVSLVFRDIVVPASRGLRGGECRRLIPHYRLASAVPVGRAGDEPAAGIDERGESEIGKAPGGIERFDTQRSAARAAVQAAITAQAKVRVEPHIPGRRYRNVRVACLVERQTTDRIALPAWVLAYRYRGNAYRAIVHGQRAEIVLGRSPIDWRKVGVLVAILAAIAALIASVAVLR